MNLYLLPWAEDRPGHFRLQGVEQLDGTGIPYAALDFRAPANKTAPGGVGIVVTDGILDVSGIGNGRLLGSGFDATIPNLVRTFLRNRLGLAVGEDDSTPRRLLRRLCMEHGREDGTRWPPTRSYRIGRFDIFELVFGGVLVFREVQPVISGGADYTESFNTADSDTLGPDLTWDELIGDWDIVGNAAQCQGGANDCFVRADHDAGTADQYVEAVVSGTTTDALDRGGVTLQEQSASSTTATNYVAFIRGDGLLVLEETTSGSGTELANASPGYTSGTLIRMERRGSGLVVKYGGTTYITTSDASLTANRRGGMYGKLAASPIIKIDQWAFGDYTPEEPYVAASGTTDLATNDPAVTFSGYTPALNDVVVLLFSSTTVLDVVVDGSLPSGWVNPLGSGVEVLSDAHGAGVLYHKVTQAEVDAATTTYTATDALAAAETGEVLGAVVRGVDPNNVIDAFNTGFDSGNTATPSILSGLTGTDLLTGSLVLSFTCQDNTGTYTTPATHVVIVTEDTNQAAWLGEHNTRTTAGVNVDAVNITPDAGDEYCSITLAFAKTVTYVRPTVIIAPSQAAHRAASW